MTRVSFFRPSRRGVLQRRIGGKSTLALPRRAAPRGDRGSLRPREPLRLGRDRLVGAGRGRAFGDGVDTGEWKFLCLAEIGNFAELRRRLGVVRAERLIDAIGTRISVTLPAVRSIATGRTSLEFRFYGNARADIDAALKRLAAELAQPIDIDGASYRCDMVLAGAAAPAPGCDDLRLAEELDEAAAIARREHRIVVRDLSAIADIFDQAALSRDLVGATARGEMRLHYQPKLHIRRQKVTGVEALIRWEHPQRGLIPPGDFIPAAEEARIIAELTLWTLDQVIADQQRLVVAGHDLEIFVNISGQLLNDAGFVAEACDRVKSTSGRIGFEITETSVIRDPETAIAHLREIAAIGVPIAIDDYGAGLSSLAYLKQLPARELKIDKMFVMQLTSSNRDPLIVRSTIDLAHAMEMEVTAEGVETQAALALLSVMGCDMAQGFLISRPVTFDALLDFLAAGPPQTRVSPEGSFNQPASFWKRA